MREVWRGALVASLKPGTAGQILHPAQGVHSPRQKLDFGFRPIKYGTRATAVDLDDSNFSNWLAGAIYWIKNILFRVSIIAGGDVNLFAAFLTAASIFGRSIYLIRKLRNKSQPVNTAESLGKPIPLQDRNASHEKSAE